MNIRIYAASLLLLLPGGGHALELAGVTLPAQVTVADTRLELNGAGIRSKFFFDIYVGALYLPRKTRDAEAAITMDGPKRVTMHFLYKKVEREKLVDAWNEGFSNNLGRERFDALKPRLAAFNELFTTVRRGDTITLDYLPGAGTRVSINGQEKGRVPGGQFYAALLRVWLGDEPADEDLKEGMLGGD